MQNINNTLEVSTYDRNIMKQKQHYTMTTNNCYSSEINTGKLSIYSK